MKQKILVAKNCITVQRFCVLFTNEIRVWLLWSTESIHVHLYHISHYRLL